jgi:hypothetical protein
MVSLFLTDTHELYSCGLNDEFQSGQISNPNELVPYKSKRVPATAIPMKITSIPLAVVLDVAAGSNHTLCVPHHKKQLGSKYRQTSKTLLMGRQQAAIAGPLRDCTQTIPS